VLHCFEEEEEKSIP